MATRLQIRNRAPEPQRVDAWSATSWNPVTVQLDNYAGKLLQLRLRFATVDCLNDDTVGAFIDDLRITAGACQDDKQCSDDSPCTTDTCVVLDGVCKHVAIAGACDDGNACTAKDTCKTGLCGPGAALSCDDANPCTDASCDPLSGCDHAANKADCSDGNACTDKDACAAGKCKAGAAPRSTASGATLWLLRRFAPCGVHEYAAGSESPYALIFIQNRLLWRIRLVDPGAVVCNDGNACNYDSCDVATGCKYMIVHNKCDEGARLNSTCGTRVADICKADSYCCTNASDALCVKEVRTVCKSLSCKGSQGTCAHPACSTGGKMVSGCRTVR